MIRTALLAMFGLLFLAGPVLARPGVDASFGPDGITLMEDGKPLLLYRTISRDPGNQPGRENYIHPLYAPDGTMISRDDPRADHRGLFWAWSRVMVDGKSVADGRMARSLTIFMREAHYEGHLDGSGILTIRSDWIVNSAPELVYVAEEITRVHVYPGWDGSRRIELQTDITPKVDGFALAGDDEHPGDSGLSLNLLSADQMSITSGGDTLAANPEAVDAGPTVNIGWNPDSPIAAWNVSMACEVAGDRVSRWLVDHTGVTCVFPSGAPYLIVKGEPLRLKATIVIRASRK